MKVERIGIDRIKDKLQKAKKIVDKPIENFGIFNNYDFY